MIGKNVAKWLNDLSSTSELTRTKAANSLSRTSESYFDDRKVDVATRARILEGLETLAADESAAVRQCAAQLTGLMRHWTKCAASVLQAALSDTDAKVRTTAVWAAGWIGELAGELQSSLLRLASDSNREVRWRVPWALGRMRQWNPNVRQVLLLLTRDADDTARLYAFNAIAQCAEAADPEIVAAVGHGLSQAKNNCPEAASQVVAILDGDWNTLRSPLERLVNCGIPGYEGAAIQALCRRWPDKIHDSGIRAWLERTRGSWWAEDLLADKVVIYKPMK